MRPIRPISPISPITYSKVADSLVQSFSPLVTCACNFRQPSGCSSILQKVTVKSEISSGEMMERYFTFFA